jgi:hypothetical protein
MYAQIHLKSIYLHPSNIFTYQLTYLLAATQAAEQEAKQQQWQSNQQQ